MERVLLYKKMSEIELKERTKELCREFFRQFEQDSMLFADMSKFKPYEYSEEKADAFLKAAILRIEKTS